MLMAVLCMLYMSEKLNCMEVSSNERPGMSPSCQDKKRKAWVLALLQSCLNPKGLQSESLSLGDSLSPLSSPQSLILCTGSIHPQTLESILHHSGLLLPFIPTSSLKASAFLRFVRKLVC